MRNKYKNLLSLRHDAKVVPYPAGSRRPDGEMNRGFINLKTSPHLIGQVAELDGEGAFKTLISGLNDPSSCFFSLGCDRGNVSESQGYRAFGYVEFAFNSMAAVADATRYFPLFFHFDVMLANSPLKWRFQYDWELMPAAFTDAGVHGYTCSIFLNSFFERSASDADSAWKEAVGLLTTFLRRVHVEMADPIYVSNSL